MAWILKCIAHAPLYEKVTENKSIRITISPGYLTWTNCSIKPVEGLFILRMFEQKIRKEGEGGETLNWLNARRLSVYISFICTLQ